MGRFFHVGYSRGPKWLQTQHLGRKFIADKSLRVVSLLCFCLSFRLPFVCFLWLGYLKEDLLRLHVPHFEAYKLNAKCVGCFGAKVVYVDERARWEVFATPSWAQPISPNHLTITEYHNQQPSPSAPSSTGDNWDTVFQPFLLLNRQGHRTRARVSSLLGSPIITGLATEWASWTPTTCYTCICSLHSNSDQHSAVFTQYKQPQFSPSLQNSISSSLLTLVHCEYLCTRVWGGG